jgi:8-oxo-dGTP pyrophosphatase MutT (NUDIX family)
MKSLLFEYTDHLGETKIHEVEPLQLSFKTTEHSQESEWILDAIDLKKKQSSSYVLKNIQRILNDHVQRILCVTVYVMDESNRFLMILNKKLGRWVPPGGKVDRNETPDEAAVRECFEETGVPIALVGERTAVEGGLIQPRGTQLNVVIPGQREHVDLIYKGAPIGEYTLTSSEREAAGIGWFTVSEVQKLHTFTSVIQWCQIFTADPILSKTSPLS